MRMNDKKLATYTQRIVSFCTVRFFVLIVWRQQEDSGLLQSYKHVIILYCICISSRCGGHLSRHGWLVPRSSWGNLYLQEPTDKQVSTLSVSPDFVSPIIVDNNDN